MATWARSGMRSGGKAIPIEVGSTNVYADLGYDDAAGMQRKSQLAAEIGRAMKAGHLTQEAAAELLGIDQSKVSRITRGQFRGVSEGRTARVGCQTRPRRENRCRACPSTCRTDRTGDCLACAGARRVRQRLAARRGRTMAGGWPARASQAPRLTLCRFPLQVRAARAPTIAQVLVQPSDSRRGTVHASYRWGREINHTETKS